MCGVPVHAAEAYLARLIRAGHRVAIAEQIESPAEAKKRGAKSVVNRAIVRVVTAGHADRGGAARFARRQLAGGGGEIGRALGDRRGRHLDRAVRADARCRRRGWTRSWRGWARPRSSRPSRCAGAIERRGRLRQPRGRAAAEGAVRRRDAGRLRPLRPRRLVRRRRAARLSRRGRARRAALPAPAGRGRRAATIWRSTRRRAKAWSWSARRPASGPAACSTRSIAPSPAPARACSPPISARRCSIGRGSRRGSIWSRWFADDGGLREAVRRALRALPDIGRALGRLVARRGGPRDLAQLRDGLDGSARAARPARPSATTRRLCSTSCCPRSAAMARWSICSAGRWCPSPPLDAAQGGYIAEGYDAALDALRATGGDGRRAIAALEARYRDRDRHRRR